MGWNPYLPPEIYHLRYCGTARRAVSTPSTSLVLRLTSPRTLRFEISVGGAPAEISTDAPARVDALISTKVTITVVEDEGIFVGGCRYLGHPG